MLRLGEAKFAKGSLLYEIANEDIASDPSYFGYLNNAGCWIIQKRVASTGVYTYTQGRSSYATGWTNRAILSYVTYDQLTSNIP